MHYVMYYGEYMVHVYQFYNTVYRAHVDEDSISEESDSIQPEDLTWYEPTELSLNEFTAEYNENKRYGLKRGNVTIPTLDLSCTNTKRYVSYKLASEHT